MLALFLLASNAWAAPVAPSATVDPLKVKNPAFASAREGDWVQGNANAPVTVTEYASLSCSHCAVFHQTAFPELQKKYIATNKIKFIYRDFPLNAPALRAAMLLRCTPEAKRFGLLKKIYDTQEKWAFNKDYEINLKTLVIDNGMSKKEFKKCLADKKIEEAVVKSRMDGTQELGVGGTPALYINGDRYQGAPDAAGLSAAIDQYLAKTTP